MKKIYVVAILIFLFGSVFSTCGYENSIISKQDVPIVNRSIKTTHMIEMWDGVKLATDVYLPLFRHYPRHGTILLRTPYNKDNLRIFGVIFSFLGWPTVIQDMRSRYASEGDPPVFRNSWIDGPTTLSWIANQSWSNGKVATIGPSALGIDQYFVAGSNPPNLTCQFIQVAAPDLHKYTCYLGGQFRKSLVEGWISDKGGQQIIDEILENENYSFPFWENETIVDDWEDVNVPAIHIGGWYDVFAQGTIDGYLGYQHLGGPGAIGKSKLIMGPWTHEGSITRRQGELVYPINSLDTFSIRMYKDMLNRYVINKSNRINDWPTVSYYVMGDVSNFSAPGNEWRYSNDWPIQYSETEWYFNENGSLTTFNPGDNEPMTYMYDPSNPVSTIGGQNLNLPAGPYDQSSIENRDDVIVFTSQVLDEPYEATGPIKARIYVASDCNDTDFTVKLTDVYPDGRSMLITDGIIRMRNRNGTDHWELIDPGEIYEVEVDLWSTSYIWNSGHKIRVAISSSNYPRFLNNPNTADAMYKNTTYKIANNTLYIDSFHPSCIILPEIENNKNLTKNNNLQISIQRFIDKFLNKILKQFGY